MHNADYLYEMPCTYQLNVFEWLSIKFICWTQNHIKLSTVSSCGVDTDCGLHRCPSFQSSRPTTGVPNVTCFLFVCLFSVRGLGFSSWRELAHNTQTRSMGCKYTRDVFCIKYSWGKKIQNNSFSFFRVLQSSVLTDFLHSQNSYITVFLLHSHN